MYKVLLKMMMSVLFVARLDASEMSVLLVAGLDASEPPPTHSIYGALEDGSAYDVANCCLWYRHDTHPRAIICVDGRTREVPKESVLYNSLRIYCPNSAQSSLTVQIRYIFSGYHAYPLETIRKIVVPAPVREITDKCFFYCESLFSVAFEDGSELIALGDFAFSGCPLLSSLCLPAGVEIIGSNALSGCIGLPRIIIPPLVRHLGAAAFANCSNALGVTFDNCEYLTEIPKDCFARCSGLKFVDFGSASRIRTVHFRAFQNCFALRDIVIPRSVKSIWPEAFSGCVNLESANFEQNSQLQTINDKAFGSCQSLLCFTIPARVYRLGNDVFPPTLEYLNLENGSSLERLRPYFTPRELQLIESGRD
jgi:hypothetical protein